MTTSYTPESQNPINDQMIEDKIYYLQRDVREYQENLTTEAIWLFLATLGCWSVTDKWFQLFAFILPGVVFGSRVRNHFIEERLDTMPFLERVKILKARIEQMSSTEDRRKEHLSSNLEKLQTNELSPRAIVGRGGFILLTCWLFYCFSLAYKVLLTLVSKSTC
jgi:hypothetical protein